MGEKVRPGDVLAGKYRVEKVLGSGGMGVVVAARHVQLDVLVALKFMSDEALADKELTNRFLREARAAARLRSEHVARVADVGTLASGAPYLVMEYLEGVDLSVLLAGAGRQPIPSAVEFIVQACDALDEAHRAGIVHRDVKPSNLFLTTRSNGTPCVKVLDFGISKSVVPSSVSTRMHATRPSALLGSPFYMAPEQMRAARDVDRRADIWALGATLYELLTGHVPFEAESLLDLAMRVASSDPLPPRNVRPEVPWALEQIVLRCLEKDPVDRFPNARALAGALAAFVPRREAPSRAQSHGGKREELGGESSEDAITRVADTALGAPSPPNAATTLPMVASVISSLPPVAHSAPRGVRTGARLSWGRSYRLLGKNPRATLNVVAVGFLLSGAAIAFLMHESRVRHRTADVAPGDAMVSAALPSLASGADLKPAEGPQAPETTLDQPAHVLTVPVADLPKPMSPAAMPSLPRPALVPMPSPAAAAASTRPSCEKPYVVDELGRTKLRSECLDAAAGISAAPAPLPNDDFEKNPYLR
jgi:eukaryotic-like serine/threonine-protein kinase